MKDYDYSIISKSSPEIKQRCRDLADAHKLIQTAFKSQGVLRIYCAAKDSSESANTTSISLGRYWRTRSASDASCLANIAHFLTEQTDLQKADQARRRAERPA